LLRRLTSGFRLQEELRAAAPSLSRADGADQTPAALRTVLQGCAWTPPARLGITPLDRHLQPHPRLALATPILATLMSA